MVTEGETEPVKQEEVSPAALDAAEKRAADAEARCAQLEKQMAELQRQLAAAKAPAGIRPIALFQEKAVRAPSPPNLSARQRIPGRNSGPVPQRRAQAQGVAFAPRPRSPRTSLPSSPPRRKSSPAPPTSARSSTVQQPQQVQASTLKISRMCKSSAPASPRVPNSPRDPLAAPILATRAHGCRTEAPVLDCQAQTGPTVEIEIVHRDDTVVKPVLSINDRVAILKLKVQEANGVPLHQQKLVWENQVLHEQDALKSLGFPQSGAVVRLVLKGSEEEADLIKDALANALDGLHARDVQALAALTRPPLLALETTQLVFNFLAGVHPLVELDGRGLPKDESWINVRKVLKDPNKLVSCLQCVQAMVEEGRSYEQIVRLRHRVMRTENMDIKAVAVCADRLAAFLRNLVAYADLLHGPV